MKPAFNSSYISRWGGGISPQQKKDVLNYIESHGTATESEIILALEMERATVRKIMSGLREKGFIMKDTTQSARSGDPYRWRATI